MSHDIFISYSSRDKVIADAVLIAFEINGLRCWYAPREIGPATPFNEAVMQGMDGFGLADLHEQRK